MPAAEKSKIEAAVKEAKDALKGNDAGAIRSAADKLNEAWQTASAEMYKAAAEQAKASKSASEPKTQDPASEANQAPKSKDEGPIIDAEVVDEKK